ncbi:MAG: hypothetical protein LRY71_16725 [Bacillaceae bacterium]|nr:hypothetical protein [Bacillaceae bacterium]
MKRNRPYSDGSVFFEKELLRIGATSSKLDQASKDVMEKSVAYQKSIINPTIIKGTISNLHPYRIYKAGQELYRCDNSKEWVKQECKAYTVGLRKYEWFIRFSFEIDGEHYCGHLYRKPEGNWSVAKTSTEKFWKEGDYDRKLKFDRNLLKSLKEQMITNIYKTFEELGIGD